MASPDKKIVFITGANQGVGYETARNLLSSSSEYHVILGSRDITRGQEAAATLRATTGVKGTVSSTQIDVVDNDSIEAAVYDIQTQFGRLDVLVNNAGIISMVSPPTTDAFRNVLETNVIGALSVTEAFLGLLREAVHMPPRLIFVTSSMGSISHAADPASPYYNPHGTEYRVSKAALNMLMTMYTARLSPDGFHVFGADPGLCATNFTGDSTALRNRGAAEPSDGGDRVAAVIKEGKEEDVGKVLGVYGVCPW